MTSDVEGIPGVAIESAMSGCPFVTFPLGGVSEVVDDGVTGLVLERADVALMAKRVAELVRDDARLRCMGAEARHRSQRFSLDNCVAQYATALAECVALKSRSRVDD
jgi:glycosyltransferase involved in cell wall biosynthesis